MLFLPGQRYDGCSLEQRPSAHGTQGVKVCVDARIGDDGIHTHRLTILIHETCEIAMFACQGGKRRAKLSS